MRHQRGAAVRENLAGRRLRILREAAVIPTARVEGIWSRMAAITDRARGRDTIPRRPGLTGTAAIRRPALPGDWGLESLDCFGDAFHYRGPGVTGEDEVTSLLAHYGEAMGVGEKLGDLCGEVFD